MVLRPSFVTGGILLVCFGALFLFFKLAVNMGAPVDESLILT